MLPGGICSFEPMQELPERRFILQGNSLTIGSSCRFAGRPVVSVWTRRKSFIPKGESLLQ